jgi:hypothetical protein
MAQRLTASDRLPWLTEVPRTPPPAPERPRRRAPWGPIAAGLAIVGVGAGAYWLGTRNSEPSAAGTGATDIVLPEPTLPDQPPGIPPVDDIAAGDLPAAAPPAATDPPRRPPARPSESARTEEPAEDDPAEELAETATGPAPAPVALPPLPTQPVVRGRIIQLGAYPTRVQADFAWRTAVKRFPYLSSKPRLISPLEVRSTDGKPTRMYRLQMATASQAQSVVICQQLEDDGQSCVVVY